MDPQDFINFNEQQTKNDIRMQMRHVRQQVDEDTALTARWKVANQVRKIAAQVNPDVVALYKAVHGEINLDRLAEDLRQENIEVALPRSIGREFPLTFNIWEEGAQLEPDIHGIPCAMGEEIVPSLIVMPCLAFDENGFRVGYGGGYYDRTLRGLEHPCATALVAYSFQEIPQVPREYHDQPVDFVITEKEVIHCRS